MPVPRSTRRIAFALSLAASLAAVLAAATPAAAQPAPRDSNHAYLRRMADHHQGLIAIVDAAMPRITDTPRKDARPLRARQLAGQQHMVHLLRQTYADSAPPRLAPAHRAMADTVRGAKSGGGAARAFYRQVVAHHREGVEMIGRMLPHLGGEVKGMAEKARGEHEREIADFRKKGGVQ